MIEYINLALILICIILVFILFFMYLQIKSKFNTLYVKYANAKNNDMIVKSYS